MQSQAECATKIWKEPDQGIWEARGDPKHYVSSKLMCWVALDRAARLAEIRGEDDLIAKWRATAQEIRADILAHGVSDAGVLRQHYETDALDASTLLAIAFGFVEPTDDLARKKLLRICSALGLYAEEFEPTTARFLGNFPQAFSHLALIEAAGKIIMSERLKEFE